jgi:hypothetical protein
MKFIHPTQTELNLLSSKLNEAYPIFKPAIHVMAQLDSYLVNNVKFLDKCPTLQENKIYFNDALYGLKDENCWNDLYRFILLEANKTIDWSRSLGDPFIEETQQKLKNFAILEQLNIKKLIEDMLSIKVRGNYEDLLQTLFMEKRHVSSMISSLSSILKEFNQDQTSEVGIEPISFLQLIGEKIFSFFIKKGSLWDKLRLFGDPFTKTSFTTKDQEDLKKYLHYLHSETVHPSQLQEIQELLINPRGIYHPFVYDIFNAFFYTTFCNIFLIHPDSNIDKYTTVTKEKMMVNLLRHTNNLQKFYIKLGSTLLEKLVKNNIMKGFSIMINGKKRIRLRFCHNIKADFHMNYKQPYLHKANRSFLRSSDTEDFTLSLAKKNLNHFIHKNKNILLSIQKNVYFRKDPILTKLSIDRNYLNEFVTLIFFTEKAVNITLLLKIYDISEEIYMNILTELNITNETSDKDKLYLECKTLFLSIQNNFRYLPTDYLYKRKLMKKLKGHIIGKKIHNFLNKMIPKKIALINLIIESFIYARFEYFLVPGFIDTRGRYYQVTSSLNVQLMPFSKMFIKVYTNHESLSSTDLQNYSKVIRDILNHPISSIKTDFIQSHVKLCYMGIRAYFKNSLSIDLFIQWIILDSYYKSISLFNDICHHISKEKNTFIAHSLILFEQLRYRGEHISYLSNVTSFDITSSGLQMISILFNDPYLANHSNLLGSNNNDIYSFIAENVVSHLSNLLLKAKLVISEIERIFSHKFNPLNPRLHIQATLEQIKSATSVERLELFVHPLIEKSLKIQLSVILLKEMDPYLSIIDPENIRKNPPNKKEHFLILLCDCLQYHYFIAYDSSDNITMYHPTNTFLSRRILFKANVMTYFYGSTSYGRINTLYTIFKENYTILWGTKKIFFLFLRIIDRSFLSIIRHSLNAEALFDLRDQLTSKRDKKPISIQNKYFSISLAPYTTKRTTIAYHWRKKKNTRLILQQPTSMIKRRKLKSSSPANIIHSMDAFVIHNLLETVQEINKRLRELKVSFAVNVYTIHDCIVCNDPSISASLFIKSYKALQASNYLDNIHTPGYKYNKSLPPPLIKENTLFNPYFIKN